MSSSQYPIFGERKTDGPTWHAKDIADDGECESLTEYRHGALCPVLIGTVFSGRDVFEDGKQCAFTVVGKLGRGAYSTVWLGRDNRSGRYLALKVLKQRDSSLDNSELRILRKLGKLEVAFFHTRELTGDRFLCLATEPLGANLDYIIDEFIDIPTDTRYSTLLVKILLDKVLRFHQKGICHGDISPGNVVFGLRRDAFTKESLNTTFEPDMRVGIMLVDVAEQPACTPGNVPGYLVHRLGPPLLTNTDDPTGVEFIDFGKVSAFENPQDKISCLMSWPWIAFDTPSKSDVGGTPMYRAPEVDPRTTNFATIKSDLMSLGCVIFFAMTGGHFFNRANMEVTEYAECSYELQVSVIDRCLAESEYLEMEPIDRLHLSRCLQCLIRRDPEARVPIDAQNILKDMEKYNSGPS